MNVPTSPESERVILGMLMLDGVEAMEKCLALRPYMFSVASNRELFQVIEQFASEGRSFDQVSLIDHLRQIKALERLGGQSWVFSLSEGLWRSYEPSRHVEIMLEKYRLKRGMEICEQYTSRFASEEDSSVTLGSMQAEVLEAIEGGFEEDEPLVAAYSDAAWDNFMDKAVSQELSTGLSYGVEVLDRWTWGMQPGEVTAIGARSGIGKSSVMKQAAAANCPSGIPVTLFSMEMKRETLLHGLWAIVSGVEYRKIRRPVLCSMAEREAVRAAKHKVSQWPLRIFDRSDTHIDQIVALARMNIRRFGTKLVIVDYAQNIEADGKDERTKVSSVSRKLTKMTKTEGNHLMLLSQLRKPANESTAKPPNVADLRETGQIENDAHIIVLLHRQWSDSTQSIGLTGDMIIPKNRDGQTGAMPIAFNPANLTFQGV